MDDELMRLTKEHELKAAETGHWVDCIKAHGLANACAVLDPTEENLRAVYTIEQTWYGGSHPLTFTERQVLTNKHKQLLEDYRVETEKDLDSLKVQGDDLEIDSILSGERLPQVEEFSKSMFEASRKFCKGFDQISEGIIKSSVEVVNRYSGSDTPCSFAAIGLGSIVREEATPISDLEYVLLVESKEHAEYFERLAVEGYFQVGNVGESYLTGFDIKGLSKENKKIPSPEFRIEGITPNSGNIPTGNENSQNLTLTVDELIEVYIDSMNSPVKELSPLPDLPLIYSNAGGQGLYDDCVNRIPNILIENVNNSSLIDKRVDMISADVKEFRFLPELTSFGPLGLLYGSMGEYSDALKYHALSLDMMKAVYGESSKHPSIAESYNSIGSVYASMGEFSDALKYHTLSLDMRKAVYGESSKRPSIAESYNYIGLLYSSMLPTAGKKH